MEKLDNLVSSEPALTLEEKQQLIIGDIVRLKSGSPVMTIYDMTPDNKIWCTWYDEESKSYKVFQCASKGMLVKVELSTLPAVSPLPPPPKYNLPYPAKYNER